jgi:hypothetical protein
MNAPGDEKRVFWAAHESVRPDLKGQLALEDAERLVEGVMVKRRSGPSGTHAILDDADPPTRLAGGKSDTGDD